MKSTILLISSLSFISAILGFGILGGVLATIFRLLFVMFFIVAAGLMFRRHGVRKPVPSSFAGSFPEADQT